MTAEEMTNTVMNIHSDIMFHNTDDNYSTLLAAVEELRYFLLYEINVRPPEEIKINNGVFYF